MRTIKYRGKLGPDWWYVTPDDAAAWAHFWELVDRTTVGQYTGLCDKQGNDIYEGDILLLTLGKHRLEARWSLVGFRFFDLEQEAWHFLYAADVKRLAIIGTIYDPVLEERVS